MAGASIQIFLDAHDTIGALPRYDPSGTINGRVQILPDGFLRCDHVFVRAGWHTEGKGNRSDARAAEVDVYQGELPAGIPRYFDFRLQLPREPWSYDGKLIRIVWEVEASVSLRLASDLRSSTPFVLRYATSG